jgi:hypothetical protein
MGSNAPDFARLLTALFPSCQCTEILAACLPFQEEAIMRGPVFLTRLFTSCWFFEEKQDTESVLQEFIQHEFIPIASFNGGLLGLHSGKSYIQLDDSVAVFSEYGDRAFDEENIWTLDIDIAAALNHVVRQIDAGAPGTIDDLLLSINKMY